MNLTENSVRVTGELHHLKGEVTRGSRIGNYIGFSIRQERLLGDGSTRKDFILARAFDLPLQEQLRTFAEGSRLRVEGEIRSSLGSGEIYLLARKIEPLSD
ncbi:MAG: OB-fold nucleic acid binding domain-containing protein [Synergistaceae bacterium]|nr:OB-fold nucleic acid binding domain-containing protein [Synergistaceae bacterium]